MRRFWRNRERSGERGWIVQSDAHAGDLGQLLEAGRKSVSIQQKAPANRCRKAARGLRRQDAEEGTAGRHPGKGTLEDADGDASIEQVGSGEGSQRAVGAQVGAEQGTAETDTGCSEQVLDESRRHVQHRDRVASEWQRGADAVESI
jgi:hypothetical protein